MLYSWGQKPWDQLDQHIAVGYLIAQLVERLPLKQKDVGANPTLEKWKDWSGRELKKPNTAPLGERGHRKAPKAIRCW